MDNQIKNGLPGIETCVFWGSLASLVLLSYDIQADENGIEIDLYGTSGKERKKLSDVEQFIFERDATGLILSLIQKGAWYDLCDNGNLLLKQGKVKDKSWNAAIASLNDLQKPLPVKIEIGSPMELKNRKLLTEKSFLSAIELALNCDDINKIKKERETRAKQPR